MLDGKVMIILLAIGLMKRYSCIKPEPYIQKKNNIKVELDLPIYLTKCDIKTQQVLIHQNLLKRIYLANLQSDIDKVDIDKIETTPPDLSKPSNAVNNELVKRLYMMNRLKKLMLYRSMILVI